jgi:hypothetical protein
MNQTRRQQQISVPHLIFPLLRILFLKRQMSLSRLPTMEADGKSRGKESLQL